MIYDCIIIGKGPAGITAGIYIKRANKNVLIIGKDGGALERAEKIENYYGVEKITGKELIQKGIKQAQTLGIEVVTDEVTGIGYVVEGQANYKVKTRNNEYLTKTIILATGASRKRPNIRGIQEYEGKGVSYCAICDAFFYKNKDVAVLGEGDYAFAEASELLPVAKSVTLLTNGKEPVENRSIEEEKLTINQREIVEFRGDTTIKEVHFSDATKLEIQGVFIAIGTASSGDLAKKLGAMVENNQIVVNEKMQTNVPALYACGDCTGGLLQISKAVHEGTIAGLEVIKFLKDNK